MLECVPCVCKAHTGSYSKLYKSDHCKGRHRAVPSRPLLGKAYMGECMSEMHKWGS